MYLYISLKYSVHIRTDLLVTIFRHKKSIHIQLESGANHSYINWYFNDDFLSRKICSQLLATKNCGSWIPNRTHIYILFDSGLIQYLRAGLLKGINNLFLSENFTRLFKQKKVTQRSWAFIRLCLFNNGPFWPVLQ